MCGIYCAYKIDLVSFLFVPALYSTLKLEIFPFTCIISGVMNMVCCCAIFFSTICILYLP